MTTNPENQNPSNQPYGGYQQPAGQNQAYAQNQPYAQNPVDPNAQGNFYAAPAPQAGFGVHPQALADAKQAKTFGILAIVLSAISLLILGFLSIAGIVLSARGLKLAKKAELGGASGPGKVLNIIGLVVSIIAALLWILTLISLATS